MFKKLVCLLALLSAVSAQAEPIRIVKFGDSIGRGYWADGLHGALDMATEPFTGAEDFNLAIDGQRLAEMHTNFDPASVADASLIIIEGGTNDINELHVLPQAGQLVLDRLQTFVSDVRGAAPNAALILSTITPRVTPGDQPKIDDYNALLRAAWPTLADGLWDAAAVPGMDDPFQWRLYKDGLHPTTLGHQKLTPSLKTLVRCFLGAAVDASYDPADFNLDGLIDTDDLAAIEDHLGVGAVDGFDLLLWQQQHVGGPSVAAIPEPGSLALAGIGLLAFTWRIHGRRLAA